MKSIFSLLVTVALLSSLSVNADNNRHFASTIRNLKNTKAPKSTKAPKGGVIPASSTSSTSSLCTSVFVSGIVVALTWFGL